MLPTQIIKEFARAHIELTEEDLTLIDKVLEVRQVPKKTILVEEGRTMREIYFVSKGCIRLFYNKDGEEITGLFFTENQFAASLDSFLRQVPSTQVLETLEPCELLVLHYNQLQWVYRKFPKFERMGRLVVEQRYVIAQQMLSSYILHSPEERYQQLMTEQPELLQRIPQHYIASYLGITPVSLSRIRKRIFS
ncbi:MAG: Crp/Fnr family transcriptional regulator [Bacteroidota bacterium]